jgi:hypothetical protein
MMPGAPAGGTMNATSSPIMQKGTDPSVMTASSVSQVEIGRWTPPSVTAHTAIVIRIKVPNTMADATFAAR